VKEFKQLGAYGLVVQNEQILLIKKNGGPYDGKLDLPGGTIEFCERPQNALIRELKEEVGINVLEAELFDADSVAFDWSYNGEPLKVHHTGIFYKVNKYSNEVKSQIEIDEQNDDSLGANYFDIKSLTRDDLSEIAIMELEKLGYSL